jgi:hypothetical protein
MINGLRKIPIRKLNIVQGHLINLRLEPRSLYSGMLFPEDIVILLAGNRLENWKSLIFFLNIKLKVQKYKESKTKETVNLLIVESVSNII